MKIALSDASYFYFLLRYTLVLTEMNPVINTINNEQRLIKEKYASLNRLEQKTETVFATIRIN